MVTVKRNGAVVGSDPVTNGVAEIRLGVLARGTYTYTATFSGTKTVQPVTESYTFTK